MLHLGLVVVVVVVVVVYAGAALAGHYRHFMRMRKALAALPGPPEYPLIGAALEFTGPLDELHARTVSLARQYGSLFKVSLGLFGYGVVVLDADDLQVVLTSAHVADKSRLLYGGLEPVLGKGLITLNGAAHRLHRKAISASLHLDILQVQCLQSAPKTKT